MTKKLKHILVERIEQLTRLNVSLEHLLFLYCINMNQDLQLSHVTQYKVLFDGGQLLQHCTSCKAKVTWVCLCVCLQFVPLIVELCTRIVEARGLDVIGVYRVPGNSVAVSHMQEELNRGIENMNMDNDKWLDVNVVSSLLKAFFRKLPQPLVTPGETFFLSLQPACTHKHLKLSRHFFL